MGAASGILTPSGVPVIDDRMVEVFDDFYKGKHLDSFMQSSGLDMQQRNPELATLVRKTLHDYAKRIKSTRSEVYILHKAYTIYAVLERSAERIFDFCDDPLQFMLYKRILHDVGLAGLPVVQESTVKGILEDKASDPCLFLEMHSLTMYEQNPVLTRYMEYSLRKQKDIVKTALQDTILTMYAAIDTESRLVHEQDMRNGPIGLHILHGVLNHHGGPRFDGLRFFK